MGQESAAVKAEWRQHDRCHQHMAVSLVRYTAGIINWRKDELEAMDRKTRKMMTIYNSLHPRADVDGLYISRKHDRRGLISIQESIDMEEQSLSRYKMSMRKSYW